MEIEPVQVMAEELLRTTLCATSSARRELQSVHGLGLLREDDLEEAESALNTIVEKSIVAAYRFLQAPDV